MKYCITLEVKTFNVLTIECVQCLSEVDSNCINNPPPSIPCNGTDMKYCITLEVKTFNGKLIRLTRTCSPDDIIKEECEDGIENGDVVIVCHRACSTDNCNISPNIQLTRSLLIALQLIILMI
ncbi:uncharacterized protein LOC111632937 [Centruroides sculpturatus]|uniref:uncharacterized protein LOC111632937 n=1 Tax=Centruroides sculpturatus TaxID=218467 RepID=UPI000C6D2CB1|nr:uncharacterized protein LOC111632937 [Centruroides sculpturatus]